MPATCAHPICPPQVPARHLHHRWRRPRHLGLSDHLIQARRRALAGLTRWASSHAWIPSKAAGARCPASSTGPRMRRSSVACQTRWAAGTVACAARAAKTVAAPSSPCAGHLTTMALACQPRVGSVPTRHRRRRHRRAWQSHCLKRRVMRSATAAMPTSSRAGRMPALLAQRAAVALLHQAKRTAAWSRRGGRLDASAGMGASLPCASRCRWRGLAFPMRLGSVPMRPRLLRPPRN